MVTFVFTLFALLVLWLLGNSQSHQMALAMASIEPPSLAMFKDLNFKNPFVWMAAPPPVGNISDEDSEGPNGGGQVELLVIRARHVENIPDPDPNTTTITSNIAFVADNVFAKWDFAIDTGVLKHNSSGEQGSQAVSYDVEVTVPKGRPEVDKIIEESLNGKFIVVVRDDNNYVRILGTKRRPMTFTHEYDSGTKFNDKNGYKMKFAGGSANVPRTYTGALPYLNATATVSIGINASAGIAYHGNFVWTIAVGDADQTIEFSDVGAKHLAITAFSIIDPLPNGMSAALVDGKVVVSGTPTVDGIFSFTVNATFAGGTTAQKTMSLFVM